VYDVAKHGMAEDGGGESKKMKFISYKNPFLGFGDSYESERRIMK
jgi:hypothetical protein